MKIAIGDVVHDREEKEDLSESEWHACDDGCDPWEGWIAGPCEQEETEWHEESADKGWRESCFWPDGLTLGMFSHLRKIVSICDGS